MKASRLSSPFKKNAMLREISLSRAFPLAVFAHGNERLKNFLD
jgi:hypothetical protein